MPIPRRGTLAQYAGRLHRLHGSKRDVIICDYVGENQPMLAKMAAKREAGYRSLGYRVLDRAELNQTRRLGDRHSRTKVTKALHPRSSTATSDWRIARFCARY
jgi:superfamily II DNA or RNA helicase